MSCRNSRSQMFWKIDVLRTSKAPVLESHFNKVAGEVLRTSSLTEHLQWLLLWFLQQNNLIFSVITITLGYNQKLSWKYKNKKSLYKNKKSLYKNIHLLSKVRLSSPKILQPFPPKSKHLDPLKHIFCIISIFLRRSGVSIVIQCNLQKVPVKQTASSTKRITHHCLRNVPETISWLSKFI